MKRFAVCFLLLGGCSTIPERLDIDDYEPEYLHIEEPVRLNGSIFSRASNINLYGEDVAHEVGDVVTVLLMESMTATKSNASRASKSSEASLSPLSLLGSVVSTAGIGGVDLSMDLASGSDFSGAGSASQSNAIDGTITVTVNKVLPNGNLYVKGEKWIKINTGEELIRLSGVIRPDDIASGNFIPSTKLADARIVYSGEGFVKDSTEPGLLYKIFNASWWPFS
jgi:flagellar L-ring protein precursor FlgH